MFKSKKWVIVSGISLTVLFGGVANVGASATDVVEQNSTNTNHSLDNLLNIDQQASDVENNESTTEETQSSETGKTSLSAYEEKVVELTNQEREKQGLQALKIDEELSKVAKEKSTDMNVKGYFSHTSPTYGSPFDMMKQYGIDYKTAGENIAKGQPSPEAVVDAWMHSEGHRANILNENFTHIGVGYEEAGNHWTQMFIGK